MSQSYATWKASVGGLDELLQFRLITQVPWAEKGGSSGGDRFLHPLVYSTYRIKWQLKTKALLLLPHKPSLASWVGCPRWKQSWEEKKSSISSLRVYIENGSLFFFLYLFPHRAHGCKCKNFIMGEWLKCDEDQSSSAPEASDATPESKWEKSDFHNPDAGARETGSFKLTPLPCSNTTPKLFTGHVVIVGSCRLGLNRNSDRISPPPKGYGNLMCECIPAGTCHHLLKTCTQQVEEVPRGVSTCIYKEIEILKRLSYNSIWV